MKITGAILFQKSVHCTALVGEDSDDVLMSHQKKAKKNQVQIWQWPATVFYSFFGFDSYVSSIIVCLCTLGGAN